MANSKIEITDARYNEIMGMPRWMRRRVSLDEMAVFHARSDAERAQRDEAKARHAEWDAEAHEKARAKAIQDARDADARLEAAMAADRKRFAEEARKEREARRAEPATQKQIDYLSYLMDREGREGCMGSGIPSDLTGLTKSDASYYISELRGL